MAQIDHTPNFHTSKFSHWVASRASGGVHPRAVKKTVFVELAVFLFGFFVQFNLVTDQYTRFLHLTDIIVITSMFILPILYFKKLNINSSLFFIIIFLLLFALTFFLGFNRAKGEYYSTVYTYIYLFFTFFFLQIIFQEKLLTQFCWGILLGFCGSIVLVYFDKSGIELNRFGFAPIFNEDEIIDALIRGELLPTTLRLVKPGGLWTHGNEAGPVLALAAAPAAYLAERHKNLLIYLGFLAFYVISFTLTLNRSGFIVCLLVGLCVIKRLFSVNILGQLVFLFAALSFLITIFVMMGLLDNAIHALSQRFLEDSNSQVNLSERLISGWNGIEILLTHPFGIGAGQRMKEMLVLSNLATPHNGFLSLAYCAGSIFFAFFIYTVIKALFFKSYSSFTFYCAVSLTGCYFFEELNVNQVFMLFQSIIIVSFWLSFYENRKKPLHQTRPQYVRP